VFHGQLETKGMPILRQYCYISVPLTMWNKRHVYFLGNIATRSMDHEKAETKGMLIF
jgi:hypothetical protein